MKYSSIKTATYPLALPSDLLGEVRQASQDLSLPVADVLGQSIRLGLPELRKQLSPVSPRNLQPLSKAESHRCFQQPNREFDAVEHHLAGLAFAPAEAD